MVLAGPVAGRPGAIEGVEVVDRQTQSLLKHIDRAANAHPVGQAKLQHRIGADEDSARALVFAFDLSGPGYSAHEGRCTQLKDRAGRDEDRAAGSAGDVRDCGPCCKRAFMAASHGAPVDLLGQRSGLRA